MGLPRQGSNLDARGNSSVRYPTCATRQWAAKESLDSLAWAYPRLAEGAGFEPAWPFGPAVSSGVQLSSLPPFNGPEPMRHALYLPPS